MAEPLSNRHSLEFELIEFSVWWLVLSRLSKKTDSPYSQPLHPVGGLQEFSTGMCSDMYGHIALFLAYRYLYTLRAVLQFASLPACPRPYVFTPTCRLQKFLSIDRVMATRTAPAPSF